ncbi:Signal transduction histidine-protein kinase BarA [Vibrio aerogenes CECT 7868]|uniref:Sensory/regulatory protein RpfC n=1 Tax=Vibrio aerogenes CECT 7868 TaxID=1216006 RepID=A0A1M6B5S5_9VIBR|nr:PAS domain S-box protein [Vibrio aerogenes]SHI44119.1 Signal transduction histidine-protein kinase BarA [Vibrio aerogenes CECT 7868]
MKLSAKLIWLFLLTGLLIISSVFLFSLRENSLLEKNTLNHIRREATILSRHIDEHLAERYNDTQLFPLVLGHVGEGQLAYITAGSELTDRLNDFVRTYQIYRRIIIFDTNGEVLAANSQNSFGKTVANVMVDAGKIRLSHWFHNVLSGETLTPERPEGVYIEGPVRGILSGEANAYDLLLAKLIRDETGAIAGVWVNLIDFQVVEQMVRDAYEMQAGTHQQHQAEILLLDEAGHVIIDMNPLVQSAANYQRNFSKLGKLNLAKSGFEDAKRAIAGLTGAGIFTDKATQQQLISGYTHSQGTSTYPGLGWSVLIRVPAEQALLLPGYMSQSLLLTGFILLIWCVGFYHAMRMIKPIRSIHDALWQLSRGHTDVPLLPEARKDEIGRMAGAVNQLRDTLNAHHLQLRDDHAKLQTMDIPHRSIHAMTTGIAVIDMTQEETPVIYVNPAFEHLTGYTSMEALGKNLKFLQDPESVQQVWEQLHHEMRTHRSCSVTVKSFKKSGVSFMNHLRLDPVFTEQGALSHYLALLTDVTEQEHQRALDRVELEKEIEAQNRDFKESENRLRAIFNTALDGIVVLNDEGIILDVNYAFETIFGQSKKVLLDKPLIELMKPEDGDLPEGLTLQSLLVSCRNRVGAPGKMAGIHASGRIFPVEISIGETWLDNRPAFVGVVRDITMQVENWLREQALKDELTEREIIYRAAFSNAAVGIARLSPEGRFLEVNHRMCSDFGYTEAELLQLSFTDITFSDDAARGVQLIEDVKAGRRKEFTIDKRYVRKNGEVLWATVSVSLVRNPDDSPKYFISVVEDISERKAFEEALRESKAQRDELLKGRALASEAGGVCNWSINLSTGALKWDDNMYALYGVPEDEALVYESWRNRLHPEDIGMAEAIFRDCIDNLKPFNCEFRIINEKTQQVHWVKAAADVIAGENDFAEMMFGINLDITEERQAQIRLEKETFAARQASESKSRFLATMSHEIRTPMNGVIGMIDLLRDTSLTRDQKRMANTVRDSAFSLLEIINDILDFSKIEAGQMALEYTETSLLTLIEKTTEALWVNAGNKGVDIFIYYHFMTPDPLLLDSVRIRQIILNLLGNSIKFTGGNGRPGFVIIHISYDAGTLTLSVEDNGIGMSEAQLGKLFRPFSQADSSTTRKYGGTGLGLSITKSFVDMMGGTIQAESQKGKGSTFTIKVPADAAPNASVSLPDYRFSQHVLVLRVSDVLLRQACLNIIEQLDFAKVYYQQPEVIPDGYLPVTVTDEEVSQAMEAFSVVVSLTRDPVCTQGYISQQSYVVGAHPLKPTEFIFGLAVSCGLESPDIDWDFSSVSEPDQVIVPDKTTAIAAGTLILCAEDQPVNQLVISRQLEKLGYAYEMADNGKIALDMWRSGRFGLVLTDCHMPEMDGYELTSEIRQIEEQEGRERTVVIALTANAMAGESEHCLKAGMDDYIAKPVELSKLKKILSLRMKSISLQSAVTGLPQESVSSSQIQGIDYEQLSSVIGTDDQSLVRAVLAMFWESVSKDLSALEAALAEQNSELIRSKAHGAKGAAASSGAMALSRHFKQVEANCNNIEMVSTLIQDIKSEMNYLKESLEADGII